MPKNVLLSLWHSDSRKVAFGLLLFGTATALLVFGKRISSGEWLTCISLTATLIGGGTLMDRVLDKKVNQVTTSSNVALVPDK